MSLSNQTIKNLSITLTPEVIDSIFEDERWAEFMMEIIPEIVSEKLGTQDMDLVADISLCIMDNIVIKPYKTT